MTPRPTLMRPAERRDAVRELMADGKVRTIREVADALGVSYPNARQALQGLRDLGLAAPVPDLVGAWRGVSV